jgi:hypothetical protein
MRIVMIVLALTLVHDAPGGWPYPSDCCGGSDCRPIPCASIRQDGDLYWYRPPGFPTPLKFSQPRHSPDELCHACYIQIPSSANGNGRCLFLPEHSV